VVESTVGSLAELRKVLYLAITKASERWSRPIKDWRAALNHFAIVFGDRVPS